MMKTLSQIRNAKLTQLIRMTISDFIEAMNNYSKDFSPIFSCVKSKALDQCKVFFSNAHISLGFGYDPPTDY